MPSSLEETNIDRMKTYDFIPLHLDSIRTIERAVTGEFHGQEGETDLIKNFMLILTPESFPIHKRLYSRTMMKYFDLKERVIDRFRDLRDGPIPSRRDMEITLP